MNATERYQRSFAAHLRNPAENPSPNGVDTQRIGVYAELVFNNMTSFLRNCFPILGKVLGETAWTALMRQFYVQHACTTPYFREIPAEFVQWLSTSGALPPTLPPFTLELAHYEWLELALLYVEAEVVASGPAADPLDSTLTLNPTALLQTYRYPVHKISADFQPQEPETAHLLIYRDTQDKVRFLALNPVTARLTELLQTAPCTGRAALQKLSDEMHHPNPPELIAFGRQLLDDFRRQGLF